MMPFPGGTAVTDLAVYDAVAADGRCGGTPHLHTASSEGYVVVSGRGAVHTLTASGVTQQPLVPGEVVWFTPGTVHRLINDDDLRLVVVMSNAGLPEAGDAVFTFPDAVLADAQAYAAAAALPDADVVGAEAMARAVGVRRDLAVEGFTRLRAALEEEGGAALSRLHARAAAIVQPRVAQWQRRWQATVAAETERVRTQLDALADGHPGAMAQAQLHRAAPRGADRGWGMCGRLRTWEWPDA